MFKRSIEAIPVASFGLVAIVASAAAAEPATTPASAPVVPDWVAQSNIEAQPLLKATADFHPEFASRVGLSGYDDKVIDRKPGADARERAALDAARTQLQRVATGSTGRGGRYRFHSRTRSQGRALIVELNRAR